MSPTNHQAYRSTPYLLSPASGLPSFILEKAQRIELDSRWKGAGYSDHFYRLYLIEEGEGFMEADGINLHLSPGYLYFIPAGARLTFHCPHAMVQYYIHMRSEQPGGLPVEMLFPFAFQTKLSASSEVLQLFQKIIALMDSKTPTSPGCMLETNGILLQLLARTLSSRWQPERNASVFLPVLTFIGNHLGDPLPVDRLAEIAGLERTHFSRQFKKVCGISPARYVRARRVEAAMHLLHHSAQTIEQIASSLGFCDAFHFSRVFKQETGIAPGQFRHREPL